MGLVPPRRRLPRAAARARRRQRRAADLRRGHHRLPRRPRRRAGARPASCPTSPSWARSSAAACPPRPTAARATLMERIAPGRRRLPGGHAVRATRSPSPPAWRRCALLDEEAYARLARDDRARSAEGLREAARRPARCRSSAPPGLLTRVLLRRARRATTRAPSAATSRPTAPGAAALLARGVYPPPSQFEAWFPSLAHTDEHVERTRRRRRRPRSPSCPDGGAGRDPRGAARTRAACSADALRRRRLGRRSARACGARVAAGPRAAADPAAVRASSSRRSARATCCTTGAAPARPGRPRPRAARRRPPLRARPRARSPRSATSRRSRARRRHPRCAPRRAPRARRSWPTPSGRPGRIAIGCGELAGRTSAP